MRYAIYFATPETSPLMQLGNRWLGRDPFSGKALEQPDIPGLSTERLSELTKDPRRYGFHGTLRAPFHIKDDVSEQDLLEACESFGATTAPFTTTGLDVNQLGQFLALTPSRADAALNSFANACVEHFEPLRAPLSEADLIRRRQSNLSPRHDELLTAWGYPYVFDEFRFHMTLSNKLEDDGEREILRAAATEFFEPVTGHPDRISTFGLYQEPERGAPFTVHTIFTLAGAEASAETSISEC